MKSVNVAINLYSLDELSEKARARAIEEHRRFLLDMMSPEDFISGDPEYDTPEQLSAVYESEYDYILFNDDPVVENIEANDYLFFGDGGLANCTSYYNGKTFLCVYGASFEVA